MASRDLAHTAGDPLEGVERSIRHYLEQLQHRTTGRDPKTNGYAYAEVPDWALRQWLDRLQNARGISLVGSAEQADIEETLQQQVTQ